MYVLDTNIVSEIRKIKAGKADPGVAAWSGQVAPGLTYISAITIQELEHGVLLAERRCPNAGAILRRWLENDVAVAFEQRTLPVDTAVARVAASLHVPNPAPGNDALVAATALAHGMALVTINTKDFIRFDQLQAIRP